MVSIGNVVLSTCLDLPKAEVQNESTMQDTKKATESQAVKFFNTSAVAVPNKDSLAAPPKELPRPELLLSWIRMTKQSKRHSKIKNAIEVK